MKRIAQATIWALLLCSSISSHALTTKGNRSCGVWVEQRAQQDKSASITTINWLMGYMTGIAVGTEEDFLQRADGESIVVWMDKYCRENPLGHIAGGGSSLANELIQKK